MTAPKTNTALAVVQPDDRPQTVALVRPAIQPAALVELHKEVTQLVAQCLGKGRDYGRVPGTDKDTLLKPGAERLAIAFGTFPRSTIS